LRRGDGAIVSILGKKRLGYQKGRLKARLRREFLNPGEKWKRGVKRDVECGEVKKGAKGIES